MFLTIFLITILISTFNNCSAKRVKRVINGWRIVGREGPYDVIKYVVAFGTRHGTTASQGWQKLGFFLPFLSDSDRGWYGTINCGGTLLTPSIVQTACHCLAIFRPNGQGKELPRVRHRFEGKKVVYIGVNDRFGDGLPTMMHVPPVSSEQFTVHERCHCIVPEGAHSSGPTFYDFGLIRIKPDWTSGLLGVPTTQVTFAPLYTQEELERTYKAIQQTQPVCLVVGWGITEVDGKVGSSFIRGAWMRIMSRKDCTEYTCTHKYGFVDMTDEEIETLKTWVCSEKVPKYNQFQGVGDSGSPVTCNNAFIGHVQETRSIYGHYPIGSSLIVDLKIRMEVAIRHTPFENSANYRRDFDRAVRDSTGFSKYSEIIADLVRKYGDKFVEHTGEDASVTEPRNLFRSPLNSVKFKSTSIARLMSHEKAVQSFSVANHLPCPCVILVFSLIALSFLYVWMFD